MTLGARPRRVWRRAAARLGQSYVEGCHQAGEMVDLGRVRRLLTEWARRTGVPLSDVDAVMREIGVSRSADQGAC